MLKKLIVAVLATNLVASNNHLDFDNLQFQIQTAQNPAKYQPAIDLAVYHQSVEALNQLAFNSYWWAYLASLGSAHYQLLWAEKLAQKGQTTDAQQWLYKALKQGSVDALRQLANAPLSAEQSKALWQRARNSIDDTAMFTLANQWRLDEHTSAYSLLLFLAAQQYPPAVEQANRWQKLTSGYHLQSPNAEKACQLTVKFSVTHLEAATKAEQLMTMAANDRVLSTLPICFKSLQLFESSEQACRLTNGRYQCDSDLTLSDSEREIIIGKFAHSYVRGKQMYLSERADFNIFVHELAHFNHFVDEYRLSAGLQEQFCHSHSGLIPNLIIQPAHLPAPDIGDHPLWSQLPESLIAVTEAKTCSGSDFKAWKVTATVSFMEYQELGVSELYLMLWKNSFASN